MVEAKPDLSSLQQDIQGIADNVGDARVIADLLRKARLWGSSSDSSSSSFSCSCLEALRLKAVLHLLRFFGGFCVAIFCIALPPPPAFLPVLNLYFGWCGSDLKGGMTPE